MCCSNCNFVCFFQMSDGVPNTKKREMKQGTINFSTGSMSHSSKGSTNSRARGNFNSKADHKSEKKFNFCAYTPMHFSESSQFDMETDEMLSNLDLSMIEVGNVVQKEEVKTSRDEPSMEIDFSDAFDDADDVQLSNIDIDGIVEQHYASISFSGNNISFCAEGMTFEADDIVENLDIDAIIKFSSTS